MSELRVSDAGIKTPNQKDEGTGVVDITELDNMQAPFFAIKKDTTENKQAKCSIGLSRLSKRVDEKEVEPPSRKFYKRPNSARSE